MELTWVLYYSGTYISLALACISMFSTYISPVLVWYLHQSCTSLVLTSVLPSEYRVSSSLCCRRYSIHGPVLSSSAFNSSSFNKTTICSRCSGICVWSIGSFWPIMIYICLNIKSSVKMKSICTWKIQITFNIIPIHVLLSRLMHELLFCFILITEFTHVQW